MSEPKPKPKPKPKPVPSKKLLFKTKSWSPDPNLDPDRQREAAWLKRKKDFHSMQIGRSKSLTDSDLEELRACFELGFGFECDSNDFDPKLSSVFPALEFYCAVNKQYRSNSLSRTSSSLTVSSDPDTASSAGSSSSSFFEPGDDPEMKKMRLRQWAQVVACKVRQHSPG